MATLKTILNNKEEALADVLDIHKDLDNMPEMKSYQNEEDFYKGDTFQAMANIYFTDIDKTIVRYQDDTNDLSAREVSNFLRRYVDYLKYKKKNNWNFSRCILNIITVGFIVFVLLLAAEVNPKGAAFLSFVIVSPIFLLLKIAVLKYGLLRTIASIGAGIAVAHVAGKVVSGSKEDDK